MSQIAVNGENAAPTSAPDALKNQNSIKKARCKTCILQRALFLNKNQIPVAALHWEHSFKHILNKYNRIYKVQLPKITPRVCRYTFCSNMGHSDINITLDTYTHIKFDDAKVEFERVMET